MREPCPICGSEPVAQMRVVTHDAYGIPWDRPYELWQVGCSSGTCPAAGLPGGSEPAAWELWSSDLDDGGYHLKGWAMHERNPALHALNPDALHARGDHANANHERDTRA